MADKPSHAQSRNRDRAAKQFHQTVVPSPLSRLTPEALIQWQSADTPYDRTRSSAQPKTARKSWLREASSVSKSEDCLPRKIPIKGRVSCWRR